MSIKSLGVLLLLFFCFSTLSGKIFLQTHSNKVKNIKILNFIKSNHVDFYMVRYFLNKNTGGLYFGNSKFNVISKNLESDLLTLGEMKNKLIPWVISKKFAWINDDSLCERVYIKGKFVYVNKFDIFNSKFLFLISFYIDELCQKGVNNILIQDDLIIRHNEGFSYKSVEKFNIKNKIFLTGYDIINGDRRIKNLWNKHKCEAMADLIKIIVEKSHQNGTKCGLNVYYEELVSRENSIKWYGRDIIGIKNIGVDNFFLMAYHRQIKEELNLTQIELHQYFKKMCLKGYEELGNKLVVKLQINDWKTKEKIDNRELKDLIDLIPEQIDSICFTPFEEVDIERVKELSLYFKSKRNNGK